MPGPIYKPRDSLDDSSRDLSVFESCEDMPQAWGGLNGNLSHESIYHDCNKHYEIDYHRKYVNGSASGHFDINEKRVSTKESAKTEKISSANSEMENEVKGQAQEKGLQCVEECFEDMEVEGGEEAVETVNVPVVEACLSVDISSSLTRQKIASVARGRTLSYVDKDDDEEPPTRRPLPLAHPTESIDVGTPLQRPFLFHECRENHKTSPGVIRSNRVSRNPSYQFAVRDATILSPRRVTKTGNMNEDKSSVEDNAASDEHPVDNAKEKEKEYNKRHLSAGDEISMPLAANMPRSVSFSGPEKVSPSLLASGSLSEGNSRSGSVSQLSAPSSKRSSPLSSEKTSPTIVRGSAITRSFRRLFSAPVRGTSSTSPPEEFWPDISDSQTSPPSEPRTPSRLRKLSSTLSRRLSTRSKMSDNKSTSSSSVTNGHQLLTLNGTPVFDDSENLVEYEDLLKLFCCSGCQVFMAPPLHQCRKGHLVCSTCRFSLKQVCPVCKQRFADCTNLMMEQVCQLVKFPCRWAEQGCPEFHRPRAKLDHEHFCVYRPVHCHHGPKGCPKVLLLRDMQLHLDQCDFKNK